MPNYQTERLVNSNVKSSFGLPQLLDSNGQEQMDDIISTKNERCFRGLFIKWKRLISQNMSIYVYVNRQQYSNVRPACCVISDFRFAI